MKRYVLSVFLLIVLSGSYCSLTAYDVNSFFDEFGTPKLQTVEYSSTRDSLISVFHRSEDIVWMRDVYRIIDMRYKQNFQLYFPSNYDDPDYKSLFRVIVDAIIAGLPVYAKSMDMIKPRFKDNLPLKKSEIPSLFLIDDPMADYSDDPNHYDISTSDAMLVHYDSINDTLSFHFYPYETFVRNQLKYLIREVIFFDRHYSRLYRKIVAIAPMQSDKIQTKDSTQVLKSLMESMLFWVSFDQLRPYLAMQYIIPSQNEIKRVTFDEFFAKSLYSSYILGEGNFYNRMIPQFVYTYDQVRKEQKRIETEILNFEQDLWEY